MRRAHGYRTIMSLFGETSQKSDANSSSVELNQALRPARGSSPESLSSRTTNAFKRAFLRSSWRDAKRTST